MNRLPFRVLYRQFLLRIIDLDLIAPQGDVTRLLGQFAALLAVVGLWVFLLVELAATIPTQPELGLVMAWLAEHFVISTTMLVVGLFAVLSWESMFPDRRDVLVLSPLPLRSRTLFLVKVAAVATALGLTLLALDFIPSLAAAFIFSSAPTVPPPQYDAATPPINAANLKSILDRDLAPAMTGTGALAPGTHGGVTVGVLQHGERQIFAYGTAQPDSIFQIGSITKTLTALLLARMVDQGKVKLDQPLRELLPPGLVAKPAGAEITLLDLATHHSGLSTVPDNQRPSEDYSVADLYAFIGKRGVAKPSGAAFNYSNAGFGLLGQALADREGIAYPYLLQAEVTGPLGMSDTVVNLSPEKQARLIQGYDSTDRPMLFWNHPGLAGAGSLHSTAGDMLTYLDAQLHPDKFGALRPAIVQSHQLHADGGPEERVALGWAYNTGTRIYWHNGSTSGFSSYIFFDPQRDEADIVLVNRTPALLSFADQLGQHIGQRLGGFPAISLANRIVSGKGGLSVVRAFAAYWATILAAGTFLFCAMLSLQGFAQLLPRQAFLRISAMLQMTLFCVILTVYFAQPGFSSLESLARNQNLLYWLPSYWFFGLFQALNGTPLPAPLDVLARRACVGSGLALGGAALAYLICYFRTLRKIAEQPDILPSRAALHWLPNVGRAFPTAVVQFSIRTLLRSRQHRVILSFYLGLAFGLAIFFAKSPATEGPLSANDPWHQVNPEMLAASIVMMGAAVLGARVVFSLPLDLRANWIFRVTPIPGGPEGIRASRRALYALAVIPVWVFAAPVFLWLWPWRAAAGHLAFLGLFGAIVAELCLHNFHKLPFTCSYLPGRSYAHMVILSLIGTLVLIVKGADLEHSALASPTGTVAMLVAFAALLAWTRSRTETRANSPEGTISFEEEPVPAIMRLGLSNE